MKSGWKIVGVMLLGGLLAAACATPEPVIQTVVVESEVEVPVEVEVTREVEVVVEPTPIGGELFLYSCLFDPPEYGVLFESFKAQYGVTVTCLEMSSGESLERIRAESENPQADVLFGNTNLAHVNLTADGLTELYKGSGWESLPDGAVKDPDGGWTGLYYGVMGIACSPERLAEIGAECPTSWAELIDPVYEGEIVIASPAASGTSYTVLSGLAQLMGEDEAFEWYHEFDKNVAQYTSSGSAPGKMAAAGEFAIGISFAHDIQVQQQKGLPVLLNFASEGMPFEVGGISIIKGAKNLAAAQAWVDWVLQPAFQRYHNDVYNRIPVLDTVALNETAFGLDDVKLIEGYDPTAWAADRDRLVARWEEEIGSQR
jgi:iron(III) transport system substrate-binding protein